MKVLPLKASASLFAIANPYTHAFFPHSSLPQAPSVKNTLALPPRILFEKLDFKPRVLLPKKRRFFRLSMCSDEFIAKIHLMLLKMHNNLFYSFHKPYLSSRKEIVEHLERCWELEVSEEDKIHPDERCNLNKTKYKEPFQKIVQNIQIPINDSQHEHPRILVFEQNYFSQPLKKRFPNSEIDYLYKETLLYPDMPLGDRYAMHLKDLITKFGRHYNCAIIKNLANIVPDNQPNFIFEVLSEALYNQSFFILIEDKENEKMLIDSYLTPIQKCGFNLLGKIIQKDHNVYYFHLDKRYT